MHHCIIDAHQIHIELSSTSTLKQKTGKLLIMQNPIKIAMDNTEYGSFDAVAKELINQNPHIDWGKPRSVSAKIGQLDKGITQWWANRPDELKCLTALLEVMPSDLGIHEKAHKNLFKFEDFPELPPLDLRRNKLFILGEEQIDPVQDNSRFGNPSLHEWLNRNAYSFRQPSTMDWLYFPDQLERELFTRGLESTSTFDVTYVETLKDAKEQLLNLKSQVISVQRDDGENDLHALASRPDGAGLLVIAPFMLQIQSESNKLAHFSWEHTSAKGLERRKLALSISNDTSSLKRWTWVHHLDWRQRILDWVEAYLNKNNIDDTLFTAQQIKQWLAQFDPKGEWFCTLSDMLHLCRIGHWNSKRLPEPNDETAGEKLVKILFEKESSTQRLKIEQLAESRWENGEFLWKGDLPLKSWLLIVPSGLTSISKNELNAVAQGKTIADRLEVADYVASKIEAGNPDTLISSGLLKENVSGYFDFKHRTLANLLIRDALIRKITRLPLSSWAFTCFDPSRRAVVDAALDVIPIGNLVDVVERLSEESPNSAESIGASEALFMAVGRRIIKKETIPSCLISLVNLVRSRLDLSNDFEMPLPWSRSVVSEDERLEWITTCWAWSLEAPLENSFHWLFPAGSSNLPEPPYWLPSLESYKKLDNLTNAWIDLLEITDQWLDDLDQPILNAPDYMSIGLIVKASNGRWSVDEKWWDQIINIRWAEDALLKRIRGMGDEVLLSLWKSLVTVERNKISDVHFAWPYLYSPVRHFLLDKIDPNKALGRLTVDELHYLAMRAQCLPPSYRGALLKLVMNTLEIELIDASSFFNNFGPIVADVLEDYLDNYKTSWAAADFLWKWVPDKVVNKLLPNDKLSISAHNVLLETSPADYIVEISELLISRPQLFGVNERVNWAQKNLPLAGFKAKALLSIMELS